MVKKVLEGIKVADFSWYAAGPVGAKQLAEHGAEVIRIESSTRLDGFRSSAPYRDDVPGVNRALWFAVINDSKYGVTLNLRHPRAKEVTRRIMEWADVVVENYTPGTVQKWGLGYEDLKKIKPSIIMVSTCNQGQTGPRARHPGFGTHLTSLSGITHLIGWPDRGPVQIYAAYTDHVAVRHWLIALLAALDYRRRTGKGQHIDVSQYESCLHLLAPPILDFWINRETATRMGNRCSCAAPHGAYPCSGEDRWCVIAVSTDEEWKSFCKVTGNPAWTADPRFATLLGRKQNEDELDQLVAAWTCKFAPEEVMVTLQAAGVPSGVVKDLRDVCLDPQLKFRGQFNYLEHPEIGRHSCLLPGFVLSKTPAEMRGPAPCLGEHNEYVYTKMLGMSDEEFVELLGEGVFE